MTRYDIAIMYGYNSVEEYDEAERRKQEIFESLKKEKARTEKEPVKIKSVKCETVGVESDYISREAVKAEFIKNFAFGENKNFANCLERVAIEIIDKVPAADVQPIKQGRWIDSGRDNDYNKYYHCSECKNEIVMYRDSERVFPKYCGECGARMNLNSVTYDRCSNYIPCDGSCFIDDTLCECDGNTEKCKGR